MKQLIIIAIVLLFAYGWYSDYRKQQRQAEQDRQNAEAVGAFVGGFLRGASEP